MSPKKRRGGMRGRGRGILKRRGPIPHQPSSPGTATADDSDVDGTSTDCNVSLKQTLASPSSSSLTSKKHAEFNEERELSLPRLKPTVIPENSTFMAMLSRDENSEYIMTDDELDHVQWDLEAMLTSVIVRRNTIKEELSTFASMQFARSLHRMAKNPKLPMIRPRAAAEISPVNECHKMKVEFDPTSKELPPSKTESANKFWSLVEPYLAHVKKEDLKWLEDMVKSYAPSKKLYDIPPLGEHYSKIWAKEELEIQKNQSSCSPRASKKLKLAERISPDVVELVNKANFAAHDGNICTPIYQRVVASLVEHSNTSLEPDAEENFPEFDDEENPQEMSNICKEFYAEQNIKKQLYKLGLIGRFSKPVLPSVEMPSSAKPEEDKDEVLEELIKCDNALAQIREMNKNHLTILLDRCRKDYYQQPIRNKLDKVNTEILNFKRQQNESWSKEEKMVQIAEEDEELRLLLEQRTHYIEQMHSVLLEPSSFLSPAVSDESDSSDEESDPSKVNVKLEQSEHNTSEKQVIDTKDDVQLEVNIEHSLNIKEETTMDEKMDCEEVNDNVEDEEHNKQVPKEETVTENIEKTVDNENKADKSDEDVSCQEDQIESKISDDHEGKTNEEESNSTITSSTRQRRVRLKKSPSENELTAKTEQRKQIKIKQEPAEYDHELDTAEDINDETRELRPRKLNESRIYFEPYDGSSSDDSEFSFASD